MIGQRPGCESRDRTKEKIRLVGYRPTERLKNARLFGFGPITWLDSLDDDVSIHVLFVKVIGSVQLKT
jgi:hypothetical protein